jgi:cell division protein FtsA
MQNSKLFAAIDIGTTKVLTVIGKKADDGRIEVLGHGMAPCSGVRKGVVEDVAAVQASVRSSVGQAERASGVQVDTAYVGITGMGISYEKRRDTIDWVGKHGVITYNEVEKVPTSVVGNGANGHHFGRKVIHAIPQSYSIDGKMGVSDPMGMHTSKVDVETHLVQASEWEISRLTKAVEGAGIKIESLVLEALASSESVLMQEEKVRGAALIDMGGGTTDIALFHGGSVKHTGVLSVGGNHVTGDIAAGLHAPMAAAEQLKQRYGCVGTDLINRDDMLEVPSVGGRSPRSVSRQILCEIIEPRLEEVFHLVRREIGKSGYEDHLVSGIVMTGGSTLLPGIIEMAERIFNVPVRQGVPTNVTGLVDVVSSPVYATGTGLLLYGLGQQDRNLFRIRDSDPLFYKVRGRMTEWFKEFF